MRCYECDSEVDELFRFSAITVESQQSNGVTKSLAIDPWEREWAVCADCFVKASMGMAEAAACSAYNELTTA